MRIDPARGLGPSVPASMFFNASYGTGAVIGINCYAASSPAEFFEVLSEVFGEHPIVLERLYTAVPK